MQARCHGLPDLDDLVDHHAVDRRADIGPVEIDAGAVESRVALHERRLGVLHIGLGDGEIGAGAFFGGDGGIERGLRGRALEDELLGAAEIEAGLAQIGFGALHARKLQIHIGAGHGDAGFLLAHARLEARRLDAGQHLVLLDLGRVVDIDLADIPGELRADIDGDEGAHGAGGRDHAAHVAALDLGGLDIEAAGTGRLLPLVIGGGAHGGGHDENEQPALFHACPSDLATCRNVAEVSATKRQW